MGFEQDGVSAITPILRHADEALAEVGMRLANAQQQLDQCLAGRADDQATIADLQARLAAATPARWRVNGLPAKPGLVLFGAAYGTNTDPGPLQNLLGHPLGGRRTYWQINDVAGVSAAIKADKAKGRLPWISFKYGKALGVSDGAAWPLVAAGKADVAIASMRDAITALDWPTWVADGHEPEGDGDLTQWVAMQRHNSPLWRRSKRIAYSFITTGWDTFHDSNAQHRLGFLVPDASIYDLAGMDYYNEFGITKNGKRIGTWAELAPEMDTLAAWCAANGGLPWAIGETGISDQAYTDPRSAGWCERQLDAMRAKGGCGLFYFYSAANPIGDSYWPADRVPAKAADLAKAAAKGDYYTA